MAPGSIFDKNYEIISFIGSGGMGSVYKARQKGLDRLVALKLLKLDQINEPENLSRFEREARSLSTLLDKHIARFYSYGKSDSGLHYIAMEYLEGKSLRQVLIEEQTVNWRRCLHIGKQICQAMAAAHEQGTINRDLKPENIILQQEQQKDFVKIIDFGLAKLVSDSDRRNEATLTRTGELVGTVHYLSPEQCRGKAADERSDIYSLGCILYEMLVGQPPFEADNPIGILHKHASEDLTFPPSTNIEMALKKIIKRATAKDAERRYQSMLQLQEDLSNLESGKAHLVVAQEEENPDIARSQKALAKYAAPLSFVLLGSALTCAAAGFWIYGTNEGKVIQSKISLINPNENKRLQCLDEADKLESKGEKKLAIDIIEAVKTSYGKDVFAFFRLENEHAKQLLDSGSKNKAAEWAWRTISSIERDSSPKSEATRESYNLRLEDAAAIILKTDQPYTKQQVRALIEILNDRTGKFTHYNASDAITSLASKIVMNSEANMGREVSDSIIFNFQRIANRGQLAKAQELLPQIQRKLLKWYGPTTATFEMVRLNLILARAIAETGRTDLASTLIGRAEQLLKEQLGKAHSSDGVDVNLCNVSMSLADNYRLLGNDKKAEQLDKLAVKLAADETQKAAAIVDLVVTEEKLGNREAVVTLSREALALTHTESAPAAFNIGMTAIGNLVSGLYDMGRREEAFKEISNHLSYLQTYNDQKRAPYIFTLLLIRANLYCQTKQHQLAEIEFLSAAKLIQEHNLGTESQARLLRQQLTCAVDSGDAAQISYVLDELKGLLHDKINVASAIKPSSLRELRKKNPELTERLLRCLEMQHASALKDKGKFARQSKQIASLLLEAKELKSARTVIENALSSGLLFEQEDWFKSKASLLRSEEPDLKNLQKDLWDKN